VVIELDERINIGAFVIVDFGLGGIRWRGRMVKVELYEMVEGEIG